MVSDVRPGVERGAVVGQYTPTAHEAVADWLCVQVGGALEGLRCFYAPAEYSSGRRSQAQEP